VSLDNNERQEIDNPLAHKSPREIRRDARRFARRHFPREDLSMLFVRAAMVARDPLSFQSVSGITEKECDILARETATSFWAQPKGLRVTTITLCVAAVIQGWNQTGSNGIRFQYFLLFISKFYMPKRKNNVWLYHVTIYHPTLTMNKQPYLFFFQHQSSPIPMP
jgi:hypothetical protein